MSTILIVDDRADNRDVLSATLGHLNHRLLEAASGEEALTIARREIPDLIISDVLMPKMDGYQFVQRLRLDPTLAHVTVVFYTANYIEDESRSLAKACGVNHVIVKPAEPEEILKTVKAALAEKVSSENRPPIKDFAREHLHLVTDKLAQKVEELEKLNALLLEQSDLLNRAADAIIIRSFEDRRIIFWNQGAERLYGWTAEEMIGQAGDSIFINAQQIETIVGALLSTDEFHGEIKQLGKDGRELTTSGRATLVRKPDGTPRSILIICTDITEQRKLETHLLRAQRLESVGILASGIAHDLNNILVPIMMAAPVLRGEMDPVERERFLDIVETSAHRGADIIKQVLTFARGADGDRVLLQPIYLLEEVSQIASQTFPKSIALRTCFDENIRLLEADSTQLHQVLLNLCINARDAMPEGGELCLGAENFDVDEHYASMTPGATVGPHVMLEVSDGGRGIPRHVIDKIFDPFFTTKDIGVGTGLGLSTVAGIVKSHGGFIDVSSKPGHTSFKVFLPAKGTLDSSSALQPETLVPCGSGQTILVVDDEPSIREVAEFILGSHGYKVLVAKDSPTALALYVRHMDHIAVVLTDLAMPGMDGFMLVRTLRQIEPGIKIIVSTGRANDSDPAEITALNVDDCLNKPYTTRNLLLKLSQVLHSNMLDAA